MKRLIVIGSRRELASVSEAERAWHARKDGWYYRAAASSTREQAFDLLDQLAAYSAGAQFRMDSHIMRGFGIGEEAKNALLKAWKANCRRE